MEEEIRQIAARIKEMREIAGLSQDELARELKITVDLYKSYEAGTDDIPVGILYKIAQKFQLELSSLITGEEPRLRNYALTRKGRGVSVQRRKDYKYQNLAYNFILKRAEPFLVTVEPEAEEHPLKLNNHPGQEFNYLLSGALKVFLDGYEIILYPGDSLYFDSGIDHGMRALNGEPAQFLAVIV
ncbi:MAG TPA: transcriptional regulator [Firmicutes bacterium]|jgi:transcriptional regulator with XRE-family HTH domain|nr:transcriptional regulator [Bacillota bacterium]HBT18102.1 transcriptional regulator [Bacillota bacterium]